ncbi:MAG: hypothetical protein MHMPM18_002873 [Marteilia pararefringens]
MKLVTHNFLTNINHIDVKSGEGYPLGIRPTKIEENESELDYEFTRSILLKINFDGLKSAAIDCNIEIPENFPNQFSEQIFENDEQMKFFHHLLFEIDIIEGVLCCEESKKEFPIVDGIPNMILKPEEIKKKIS